MSKKPYDHNTSINKIKNIIAIKSNYIESFVVAAKEHKFAAFVALSGSILTTALATDNVASLTSHTPVALLTGIALAQIGFHAKKERVLKKYNSFKPSFVNNAFLSVGAVCLGYKILETTSDINLGGKLLIATMLARGAIGMINSFKKFEHDKFVSPPIENEFKEKMNNIRNKANEENSAIEFRPLR